MTGSSQLERRYRRVLACYPKAFRRESEEEILAVLLATAAEGQRRAGLAESADLLRGALRMHFGLSRSPRPVRNAVRLMCAGAVLTLAGVVTVLVTLGGVRPAAVHDLAAGQWPGVMLTQAGPWLASAPIGAGLWLWLAWANGRGYHWARPAFVAFFGVLTIVVFFGLGEGGGEDALPYTWADVIATTLPGWPGWQRRCSSSARRPARTTSAGQQREQQHRRTEPGGSRPARQRVPAHAEGLGGFGRLWPWPSLSSNPQVQGSGPWRPTSQTLVRDPSRSHR